MHMGSQELQGFQNLELQRSCVTFLYSYLFTILLNSTDYHIWLHKYKRLIIISVSHLVTSYYSSL